MSEKITRTAAFHTLGCKVNSYETEAMKGILENAGIRVVPFEEPADIYIVNTCSVTNIADRKSRQMLHRARAMNPDALIIATGCYAQQKGESILQDETVDLVLGNDRKSLLPDLIREYEKCGTRTSWVYDIGKTREYEEMPANCSEHTRAFLKIEDGCNQFCSYCLIPYVRGRVRSRRQEDILAEAARLAAAGYRELVLTGIHLSSYGLDFHGDAAGSGNYGRPLLELLKKLNELPGIKRIRLGSLEPRVITPEYAGELAKIPKLCPHFHLSLQSGCDSVLKRMNRHYSAEEFLGEMQALRDAFDRPALTTDVIVGFPGETDEEFAETVAFLEKADFYEIHIFRYSRRAGTAADRMTGQLPESVKISRSQVLQELMERHKKAFETQRMGEMTEILLEEQVVRNGKTLWRGHTPEYLELFADVPGGLRGDSAKIVLNPDLLA